MKELGNELIKAIVGISIQQAARFRKRIFRNPDYNLHHIDLLPLRFALFPQQSFFQHANNFRHWILFTVMLQTMPTAHLITTAGMM